VPFLTVRILGADISEHALEIYRAQMGRLEPVLAGAGISVSVETRRWDATDVQQTNDLIDRYLQGPASHSEYLVLLANFSGPSKTLFQQFEDSFRQVWIRLSGRAAMSTTILWVEPEAEASKNLFKKLGALLNPYTWFQRAPGKGQSFLGCKYDWFLRIQAKTISSGVIVHRYSRAR